MTDAAARRVAPAFGLALVCGLAVALGTFARLPAQSPPPAPDKPQVFKAGVELIVVDVRIVDKSGYPVAGLRPDQFDVTIDGEVRRVVSADFVEYAPRDAKASVRPAAAADESRPSYSTNDTSGPPVSQGRLIYLAVDQGSFRAFGARGAMEAARRFIDRLQPADRVGLIAFPPPGPNVPASRDHKAARSAAARIVGAALGFNAGSNQVHVSLAEALDIRALDNLTFERVVQRECLHAPTEPLRADIQIRSDPCERSVLQEADSIARTADAEVTRSLWGIDDAIRGLAQIRERKTLVLISAGLPMSDRIGRDVQTSSTLVAIGRQAAAANLDLYVLHIDSGFLDAFSAEQRTMSDTLFRDLGMMSAGLDVLAGAGGGSLVKVAAGADSAFDRIARETAAAYVLGVEPAGNDRDGKTHRIAVKARVPGAEIRSRREFAWPKAEASPATPEGALLSAFNAGRQVTDLPIRVSTHTMASRGGGHVVYLSADIGDSYRGPADMRVMYAFTDAAGRSLPPVRIAGQLRPRQMGRSGSVSFTLADTLKPGSFTLRLAAADAAGRCGSVDHRLSVSLADGTGIRLSDVMLVEPLLIRSDVPTIVTDGDLRGPAVEAYIEITPRTRATSVTAVTFGIAEKPDGPPLVSVPGRLARLEGEGLWTAAGRFDLTALPPGDYAAVAIASAGGRVLGRVHRPVHIDRPAPAASGAAVAAAPAGAPGAPGAGEASSPRVRLSVTDTGNLVRPFERSDVLKPDSLGYFFDRLAAADPGGSAGAAESAARDALRNARYDEAAAVLKAAQADRLSPAFLMGLALFGRGELEAAAERFRAALDAAPDFLPAAFYLGSCYAAGGKDREAAGAWQAALITEGDARIVYDVLGDAHLRLRHPDEALSILDEARAKWTDDDTFVPRAAAGEAMRGEPAAALALLDPYLLRHPADSDALFLALRLLYDGKAAGRPVLSAEDDRTAALRYGGLYEASSGQHQALVKRWVAYVAAK